MIDQLVNAPIHQQLHASQLARGESGRGDGANTFPLFVQCKVHRLAPDFVVHRKFDSIDEVREIFDGHLLDQLGIDHHQTGRSSVHSKK